MCRFALYLGPPLRIGALVTDPNHSLIHQSFRSEEREEPLNGDGFGLAWYPLDGDVQPAIFRSTTPAWSNRNLLDLARVVASRCILAHVRAATHATAVSEANCHPFRKDCYAFMHNGDVGGFPRVRRTLLRGLSDEAFHLIEGTTDSEHVFALLFDRMRDAGGGDRLASMAAAVRATLAHLVELVERYADGEPSYLNFAITDGARAVAARFTTDRPEHAESLHYNVGHRYVCEDGVCRMHEGGGAVLVSSERLTPDPGWAVVPANHLVLIDADRQVRVEAC